VEHTITCKCGKLAIKCNQCSKALILMVTNAKKEVFDDLESYPLNLELNSHPIYQELKKKHLNPNKK